MTTTTAIGINHRHWDNALAARRKAQRRRDEIDTEDLLDELGITDEDERAELTGVRCDCGTIVLVEGDYVPFSPAGTLRCASCIEDAGGTCDGPGAIVRD